MENRISYGDYVLRNSITGIDTFGMSFLPNVTNNLNNTDLGILDQLLCTPLYIIMLFVFITNSYLFHCIPADIYYVSVRNWH